MFVNKKYVRVIINMVELIQEQMHFLKVFIQTTSAQRKGQPEVFL